MAVVVASLLFAGARMVVPPIATEHNVKVLQQVAVNKWAMESDEEGKFLYTGCDDFPNSSVIWAGYMARVAKWKEFGNCRSIRDTGLGFWWHRDSNYDTVPIQ